MWKVVSLHSISLWLFSLAIFVSGTAGMRVERIRADNYQSMLKKFEYGCSEMPWITGCENENSQSRPFFVTLFDEDGNILESVSNKSVHISASKPIGVLPTRQSMIEQGVLPGFLYKVTPVPASNYSFEIATADGRRLHLDSHGSVRLSTPEEVATAWKMYLVGGIFLQIESKGRFLKISNGILAAEAIIDPYQKKYLFTGVRTSFVLGLNLERGDIAASEGLFSYVPRWGEWMTKTGVSKEAYGDVEVTFATRNGTLDTGYICGYGWGFAEAATVCRQLGYETGMPTYRGIFSGWMREQRHLVMSGLKCNGEESHLSKCPIYSQFSRENRVVGQESRLRQEGAQLKEGEEGTSVYACKQKEFNAAGVVCGRSNVISSLVGSEDEDIKCLEGEVDVQPEVLKLGREASVRRLMTKVVQGGGIGEFHWTSFVNDILSAVDRSWRTVAMSANIPWSVDLNEGTDVQAGTTFTPYVVDSQRSAKNQNDQGVNRYRLLGNVPFLVKTRKDLILSASKILKPEDKEPKIVQDLLAYTSSTFDSLKGFISKLKVGMRKLGHNSNVMDSIIGNMLAVLETYTEDENHSSSLSKLTKSYLKLSEECSNTTEASLRRIEDIGEELDVFIKQLEQFIQKLLASKRRSLCVPIMCQAYLNFGLDKMGARCVTLCNDESAISRILENMNSQLQILAKQTRDSRSRKDHRKIKKEIDSWLKETSKSMKKKTETLLVTTKMVGLIYNSVNSLKSKWGQLHSHYSNMKTVIERRSDKTRLMLDTFEMAAENPEYAKELLKYMASSALEIMLLNHHVERIAGMTEEALGQPLRRVLQDTDDMVTKGFHLRKLFKEGRTKGIMASVFPLIRSLSADADEMRISVSLQKALVASAGERGDIHSQQVVIKHMLRLWDRFGCFSHVSVSPHTGSLEEDTLNGKRMLQLLYENAFYPNGTVALEVPDERYNKLNVRLDRDEDYNEDYEVSFEFE